MSGFELIFGLYHWYGEPSRLFYPLSVVGEGVPFSGRVAYSFPFPFSSSLAGDGVRPFRPAVYPWVQELTESSRE